MARADAADTVPAALDAERVVLGAMLTGAADPALVAAALDESDLGLERHRVIWRALMALHAAGRGVDYITVAEQLRAGRQLDTAGGLGYLVDLDRGTPAVPIDAYLRVVRERAVLRRTIAVCQSLIDRCRRADAAADVLSAAERLLTQLSAAAADSADALSVHQAVERAAGSIDALIAAPPVRLITTPWPALNRLLGGIGPGQLIVLAARPGVGKSAAACQIADRAASGGHGVLLVTLEMGADEIIRRLACMRAGVDLHQWRSGRLTQQQQRDLYGAISQLADLPLWLDDRSAASVASVTALVRRMRARHQISLLVVDYLQLMRGVGRHESRVEEIAHITRALKILAREAGIGVLLLSQLNRLPEVERRRPTLADLRESGSIEQDADAVVFLHEDLQLRGAVQTAIDARTVEFIVAKQRNGPRGKLVLRFNPRYIRFEEVCDGE